jgi:hypothetical protein
MAFSLADAKLRLRALFSHQENSSFEAKTAAERPFTRHDKYVKAVDAMASDTTANTHFFVAPRAIRVLRVTYLPLAAVTANATNYGTLILNKDTGAGADTVVASRATDTVTTDDMAAGVPWDLVNSSTAANLELALDDKFGIQITKTGTGVAIAAGHLIVYYEEI